MTLEGNGSMDTELPSVEDQQQISPAFSNVSEESPKSTLICNGASQPVISVVPSEMPNPKYNKKGHRVGTGESLGVPYKCEAFQIVVGQPGTVEQPSEDLFKSLKFFLIVGRFLGVLPYSGVFGKSYLQLYFYPKSLAAIISIGIFSILSANVLFGLMETMRLPKTNAFEIAKSVRASIQFVWGWLIYLNFLVRGKKFLGLFYYWAKTKVVYAVPDRHLRRDVIFITLLILTSAILENAILTLEYFPSLDDISGTRFPNNTIGKNGLETLYRRSHEHWWKVVTFHEVISVVAFIQHKCMLYSLNYMDVMIAVFSRAMYFRFKILNKLATEQLVKPLRNHHHHHHSAVKSNCKAASNCWTQIAYDHKKLCDLLQELENFFSPLIFGSYAVNIFYICIQLLDGLTVDISTKSLVHSVYAPWSFLHIIMRVFTISICAARINSHCHKIRNVLQECPIDQYNAEIARLDKKVTTGPENGLTGLGCFVVTKPFLLKIISVVFTFEIVLLQGAPPATGNEC